MSRLATMFAALADTALAVVVGILTPLAVAAAGWLISGSFQTTPWEVPLAAAMALWTLGLTSAVGFTVHPEAFPSLQLAEPFGFVVSLAPLAITAYIAWFAWRTGRRIVEADEDGPWLSLAVSAAAFIIGNQLALQLGGTDIARLEPGGVAAGGTLIWVVGLLAGARIWEFVPWTRLLGDRTDAILTAASRALRLALGFVVGLFALASALVLVGLVLNMGDIVGLTQLLQLDAWGNVSVGLTELLYLPTLLVWAIAWLLGAGVQFGAGTMANPGATDAGPLPILPLLGVVPEPHTTLLWSLLALPVLLAAVLTMWLRTTTKGADAGPWWQRLIVPASGAIVAALILTWLAYLSRGAVGPGRLTEFGPVPWLVLVYATALLLIGAVAGAYIPVPVLAADELESPEEPGAFRDLATEDLEDVRTARTLRAVEDDADPYAEFDDLDGPARTAWWRRAVYATQDRLDDLTAGRRRTTTVACDADGDGDWPEDDLDHATEPRDQFDTDELERGELRAAESEAEADEFDDDDEDAPLTVVRRARQRSGAGSANAHDDDAAADASDEPTRDNDAAPEPTASDRATRQRDADQRSTRGRKPAPRRDLGDLADALRRPDEPDIYGDIDLDEAPRGPRK
ncbi:cell division protein PerM [Gulosibacter sediminis]|uniref:cell division protein PerM n=1 Tax=Gulosibacter sediminis TaxID=1729695 RepID=UPI0024A7EDE8|nr:DUF6350 family protein [Gulosibacter sediminis]